MFNKDKNNLPEKLFPASATLISTGTSLQGDLTSDNDLRIDGTIRGNITSRARVVIGPAGLVEGDIDSVHADVSGKLVGNINAKESVQLRSGCHVHGNIAAASLQVEAGALFNGQSQMAPAGNVVVMKDGESTHAKAK